ncbi:hypothetical protein PHISP_07745 [Aspergillus sp. HF37]|nr:hypothetical protein PHISP_07745 [Aspergillus sp. HF37]
MDDKNLLGKERVRRIRREVEQIHWEGGGFWGFVVYRTTYSPESASVFPRIMDVLGSFIKKDIYSELVPEGRIGNPQPNPENLDPTPNDEVCARYAPIVMDDPRLDGASLDTVRAHFESWVDGKGKRDRWNMYRLCMVIDNEVLQVLKDVPLAEEYERAPDSPDPYVKFVEAWPDTDVGPPDYEGWITCPIDCLYNLWDMMDDGSNMGIWACDDD